MTVAELIDEESVKCVQQKMSAAEAVRKQREGDVARAAATLRQPKSSKRARPATAN